MSTHKTPKGFTPQHFYTDLISKLCAIMWKRARPGYVLPAHKSARGFIALTSALIISAVMLLIATGGSLSGFYTRIHSLDAEYKERSFALAEACARETLLHLAVTPSYTGDATTTVSSTLDGQCYTGDVDKVGNAPNDTYQFRVRAIYEDSYSSIAITAKVSDLSITSYTEIPVFY